MEDQFGGRTDDDLFYDDFEPIESQPVVTQETAPSPAAPVQETPAPKPASSSAPPAPAKSAPKGLASSRYADSPEPKPSPPSAPREQQPKPQPEPQPAPQEAEKPRAPKQTQEPEQAQQQQAPQSEPSQPQEPSQPKQKPHHQKRQKPAPNNGPPASAPTAPRDKSHRSSEKDSQAAAPKEARLQSGANPRQKLTEAELTAKMEQMKIVSAEKTRKFEKAEQDEKQHAQAYARGMEEARKRKVEAEERRRRGEENQRKLNDERAKNRERKLKAMGMKEGGWDEGKEALAEEESRRGFKGANGGVRGTRSGGGLGGSRYAREGEEAPDVDRFLEDRGRGRRRGGGGGGRGRGGNGRGGRGGHEAAGERAAEVKQSVPTTDDFPVLPSDGVKQDKSKSVPEGPALTELPKLTGGKWDDEMADLDAANQKA